MFSGVCIISYILFLAISTNGLRIRAPCGDSTAIRCDNSGCIQKHKWCNNVNDCSDASDEKYCYMNYMSYYNITSEDCNGDIHFKCSDNNMCIPREAVCDGYSSCPDMSDEKDCPCEKITEDVGKFQYQAYLGSYRTQQKCWKIAVNPSQFLKLQVQILHFCDRDCSAGNVTVSKEKGRFYDDKLKVYRDEENDFAVLCPLQQDIDMKDLKSSQWTFEYSDDVLIRYSSNYYVSNTGYCEDRFETVYTKVDKLCKDEYSFKCSEISCISPQKRCDGQKDCENGLDEKDCDYGAFNATYLVKKRTKAIEWIKSQHNADWGWRDNTHRAVVALYLSGAANNNGSSQEEELIVEQLQLEVLTYIFGIKDEKMSPSELSSYINALLVTCHDPRNFYGSNLIALLKEVLETPYKYASPFNYLTFCIAKEHVPIDAVHILLELLEYNPEPGFVLEIRSLAVMALSCIASTENMYAYLQQNITKTLNDLKKEQKEDGSFGNEYTTALVMQALKASNQEYEKDWRPKSALEFLSNRQQENGSFGDFFTTYLVLPLLNAKTLTDIGTTHCKNTLRKPRDGNKITGIITNKLGKKMMVTYSLYIGDDRNQIHHKIIKTPENITLLKLMSLAADNDPIYKFKTHEIEKKLYVYEISNILNDPLHNKFWYIHKGVKYATVPASEQSPDRIRIQDQDHIIMWYKTLDIRHPFIII